MNVGFLEKDLLSPEDSWWGLEIAARRYHSVHSKLITTPGHGKKLKTQHWSKKFFSLEIQLWTYINRRIRLTCLHPQCCYPVQIMWWFIWKVTIVQFVTLNCVHENMYKQNNCNLPNESSHDLNWVATKSRRNIGSSLSSLGALKKWKHLKRNHPNPRVVNR